jgi:hypothetical protein
MQLLLLGELMTFGWYVASGHCEHAFAPVLLSSTISYPGRQCCTLVLLTTRDALLATMVGRRRSATQSIRPCCISVSPSVHTGFVCISV